MTTNTSNHEKTLTREQLKQKQDNQHPEAVELAAEKDVTKVQTTTPQNKAKIRIRMVPIWLRLVVLAALLVVSLLFGAIVGYGVIGDGSISDVFKKATWTHISDLIGK